VGANGADLYAMGRLLERPQHIADRVGASLLVVTHYNRARDLRGAARITGAGPAEWGRVLISTQVVSRRTDPDTRESTVIVELDVQGGEVPDQTIRVRRTVRAVDPDDLDSPLVYRTDEPGGAPEDHPQVPGLPPATAKVLAVLEAQPDHVPADVQVIGDWIAQKYGGGLKRPTISKALTELSDRGLVDHVEHPRTGRKDWFRVTAGAS
jgi:hypothetical protein